MAEHPQTERWVAGGLALATFLLAWLTLPAGVTDADNGEFLLVAQAGGIPHPPGYPLYAFFLQLWERFAFFGQGFVPHHALLSAGFGAATTVCLFRFCRIMGATLWASAGAVLGAMSTVPVWRMNTLVEPFALHHFLLGLILVAVSKCARAPKNSSGPILLGFLWGLCFCNHHAAVFLIPFVLVALGPRLTAYHELKTITVRFGFGFLIGLLPLLYFLGNFSGDSWIWGDWSTLERLPAHLFRSEYGTFQWSAGSFDEAGTGSGLLGFARSLTVGGAPVLLILGVAGVARLRSNAVGAIERRLGLGLLASFLIYVFLFLGLGVTGCSDPWSSVLQRFLGFPYLVATGLVAVGLDHLRDRLNMKPVPFLGVVLAGASLQTVWNLPLSSRRDETFVQTHLNNILNLVEPGDVLVAQSDVEVFGLLFMQTQEKKPYDVVSLYLYSRPWYRERLAGDLGLKAHQLPDSPWELLRAVNGERRIVLLDPRKLGTRPEFASSAYPLGPVLVVPKGQGALPSPDTLFAMNQEAFEKRFRLPASGTSSLKRKIERNLFGDYAFPWEVLCDVKGPLAPSQREMACTLARKMNPRSQAKIGAEERP